MPELREDQKEDVEKIHKAHRAYKGFVYAARPGYGKTAPTIEIIKRYINTNNKPVCVVSPAYLVYNWLDEFESWGLNEPMCVIDSRKQILHDAKIYIGSYNMMAYEDINKQLLKKGFSLLVCDEAHCFRTWNSQQSRRILGTFQNIKSNILFKSEKCVLLTGTPIVNRVEDIYNIVIRIAPQVFKNLTRLEFITKYSAKVDYTPWGVKSYGVRNEKELKQILKNVMHAPQIIKDLPPRIDKHIRLKLKGAELKRYIIEETKFLQKHKITPTEIVDMQSIKKTDVSEFAAMRQRVALHKIPLVMPAIIDAYEKGERPIIYCWHRDIQIALHEKIKNKLKKAKIEVVNGSVPTKKRFGIVEKYQTGQIDILLSTIGALREGVNLTKGSIVIFVELPYTPAEVNQVVARLHRSGQESTVYAHFFYFDGGIDKHIVQLLKQKQNVITKVVG